MKVVLSGADGFLGWHLRCRLKATRSIDVVPLTRAHFENPDLLSAALTDAEAVFHIAGINRAADSIELEAGNVELAVKLGKALQHAASDAYVIYANSIQSSANTPYGRGKRLAGEALSRAAESQGKGYAQVLLPNLFGEHGKPNYNSFVATFCHALASGAAPSIKEDRLVPLLHVQDAAELMARAADSRQTGVIEPPGSAWRVSAVLEMLREFHEVYGRGEIPSLENGFRVDMFNTYRSYLFPAAFPMTTAVHSDPRGRLFEAVRSHGGTGQAYISTTVPGATRGEHFHLRKIERFMVVAGEAVIALRRLYANDVVQFRVSGARPTIVDMPTMWVHNIRNVGDRELVTLFWADQLLDPQNPDQYAETVYR